MKKENRIWTLFGKFSALVFTLAALLTIYFQFFPSKPDLVVTGSSFNSYALPVDLIDLLKESNMKTSYDSLEKYMEEYDSLDGLKSDNNYKLLSFLSKKLKLNWGVFSFDFNHYRSFLYFDITNSGSKPSEDIVFYLPVKGVALITEENDNQSVVEFNKEIKLKELRPSQTIKVAIWSPSIFYHSDETEIKISDQYSVGSVSMSMKVDGLAKFVSENLFIISFLLIILFIFMFGIAFTNTSDKDKSDTKTEVPVGNKDNIQIDDNEEKPT